MTELASDIVAAIEVDKSKYGEGPWQSEPDRHEWKSEAGYACLASRNKETGAWCGYVAVPPGHPCHGSRGEDLEVHGGVNYAHACQGHVCHAPAPGEPDGVWWLGFDCAHAFDVMPALRAALPERLMSLPAFSEAGIDYAYRDLEYVKRECESLAQQLAARGQS